MQYKQLYKPIRIKKYCKIYFFIYLFKNTKIQKENT